MPIHPRLHFSLFAGLAIAVFAFLLATPPAGAQVYLVEDINPGAGDSGIWSTAALGDLVFFNADDGTTGLELWASDGTAVGTYQVKDIWTGSDSSSPEQIAAAGGYVYFLAADRAGSSFWGTDLELWVSDSTSDGTESLDLYPGTTSSEPYQSVMAMGGSVYVSAIHETMGRELWVVTGDTPSVVKDIRPGDSNPTLLGVVHLASVSDDRLFFKAWDDSTPAHYELWMTDGSEPGTVKLTSVDDNGVWPGEMAECSGRAWFYGQDLTHGYELWVSDGTAAGTYRVNDINPGSSSTPHMLTAAGDKLFYFADDGSHGDEMWVTDCLSEESTRMDDINSELTWTGVSGMAAFNDLLFFSLNTEPSYNEVWTSDGTSEGTELFKDINPGGLGSMAHGFHEASGMLIFIAHDGEHGIELWGSDGTPAGTARLTDILVDPDEILMWIHANTPDFLAIQIDDGTHGRELFALPLDDVISVPDRPVGEEWGYTKVAYPYDTDGAVSLKGNDVQYRFHWGDGESGLWLVTGTASDAHEWQDEGDYGISVEARSAVFTDQTSYLSRELDVNMAYGEVVHPPVIDGPTEGSLNTSYSYTIDADSNYDHDLEYTIAWGDGTVVSWTAFPIGETTVSESHSWDSEATYSIQVEVRCAEHTGVANSNSFDVEITGETISVPEIIGTVNGYPDVSYDFTLSASSSKSHDLEYRVVWGDGDSIGWTAFGSGLTSVGLSHTWTSDDTYSMEFYVRCAVHTVLENSETLSMFIVPEVVSDKSLDGPTSGISGVSYEYTLTAHSASEHDMQYQIYWGHGDGPGPDDWYDIDPVTGVAELSHTFPVDGFNHNYQVDYGVRCKAHNDVQEWDSIFVSIPGETITNHTLGGPVEGLVGIAYDFTVTGTSSDSHALEYKFDWGDGFPTGWAALSSGTKVESYAWAYPDQFNVTSSVRCTTHNQVLSEKQQLVTITADTPPDLIFADGFESGNTSAW